MADAYAALYELADRLAGDPIVASAHIEGRGNDSCLVVVELVTFDVDAWDRVVRQVEDLAREDSRLARVSVDITVRRA